MNLSPEQEDLIERIAAANDAYQKARQTALAEAKAAAEARVEGLLAETDRLVRIAHESGVPKRRIHREGLGTSAPRAVYDSLQRTEGQTFVVEVAEPRYSWAPEAERFAGMPTVRVTMAGPQWDTFVRDHRDKMTADVAKVKTATFFLAKNGTLAPTEPDTSTVNRFQNPVAAFVRYYGGEQQVREWMEANDE